MRYYKYQRDGWLLASSFERGLMAIALMIGSLTIAPHPPVWLLNFFHVANLKGLLIFSRYSWFLAFVPFAIGVFLEWHSMARIKREQNEL